MSKSVARAAGLAVVSSAFLAAAAGAAEDSISVPSTGPLAAQAYNVRHVIELGEVPVTIRATGEQKMAQVQEVWKPICSAEGRVLTVEELAEIAAEHERIVAESDNVTVVDSFRRMGGTNFVFNISGSTPAGATGAFALAEAYLEATFSDPISIVVNVTFQNLGGGVLGATNTTFLNRAYAEVRDGLIADMDMDDELQDDLPAGTTIGVRYNGASASVNNESRVFVSRAAFNAGIGTTNTNTGSMTYNSAFNWDFDPSNGVPFSRLSLVDVIIHETGHAMGFTSGADFRTFDMEILDLARFQRTDGTGDFNPDTIAEWTTTPRLVDFNSPNDAHNTDLIDVEYRMSDGNPFQASHFREQNPSIGNMDPALSNGQTFFPNYFLQSDIDAFDFIGYDFPAEDFEPCIPDFNGDFVLNNTDINAFAAAVILDDPSADLNGDGAINNTDINLFVTLFLAGCP